MLNGNTIEKVAVLCGGAALLAYEQSIGHGVATAVAMAGLAALGFDAFRKHGPESGAHIERVRRATIKGFEEWSETQGVVPNDALEEADRKLGEHLQACFPEREELARLAVHPLGFAENVSASVMERLAQKDPIFSPAHSPGHVAIARDLAKAVIVAALKAAITDKRYVAEIQPHLLFEQMRAFGIIIDATKRVDDNQIKLAEDIEALPTQVASAIHDYDAFIPALDNSETADRLGGRAFYFRSAQRVPLVGRKRQLDELKEWLDASAPFSWALITGAAGTGKSRLAFELCQQASPDWRAGFLVRSQRPEDASRFENFKAQDPTLIVVDYVALQPDYVGRLVRILRALSLSKALQQKVRLLLLERDGPDENWLMRFYDGCHMETEANRRQLTPETADLSDQPLTDDALWDIMDWFGAAAHSNQEEALATLEKIDSKRRPLFASLVGDALSRGNIGEVSRDALLNDILSREEVRWRKCAAPAQVNSHKSVAGLATICGGVSVSEAQSFLEHVSKGDSLNIPLLETIVGIRDDNGFPSIEPDLIGEWFVLQHCLLQDFIVRTPRRDNTISNALTLGALNKLGQRHGLRDYFDFMFRTTQDFPAELAKSGLINSDLFLGADDEHEGILWNTLTQYIINKVGSDDLAVCSNLYDFAETVAKKDTASSATWSLFMLASSNLASAYGEAKQAGEACALYKRIHALQPPEEFIDQFYFFRTMASVSILEALVDCGEFKKLQSLFKDFESNNSSAVLFDIGDRPDNIDEIFDWEFGLGFAKSYFRVLQGVIYSWNDPESLPPEISKDLATGAYRLSTAESQMDNASAVHEILQISVDVLKTLPRAEHASANHIIVATALTHEHKNAVPIELMEAVLECALALAGTDHEDSLLEYTIHAVTSGAVYGAAEQVIGPELHNRFKTILKRISELAPMPPQVRNMIGRYDFSRGADGSTEGILSPSEYLTLGQTIFLLSPEHNDIPEEKRQPIEALLTRIEELSEGMSDPVVTESLISILSDKGAEGRAAAGKIAARLQEDQLQENSKTGEEE